MKTILVILLMSLSLSATAGNNSWKYHYGDNGKHYITDGPIKGGDTNFIEVKDRKAAKKLAKKLNKVKSKDKEGFWNEQYCSDPTNQC